MQKWTLFYCGRKATLSNTTDIWKIMRTKIMLFKFDWKIGRSWPCCYGFWNANRHVVESNMATTIKTPDWWLDYGATIHVMMKHNIKHMMRWQDVLIGNHNSVKVLGRGSVELQFTYGKKLTLINAYHVPEIRKYHVYANLVCNAILKSYLSPKN